MQRVLKSYSREAKQNHEIVRPNAGQTVSPEAQNGNAVQVRSGRRAWGEPFEERSTFETHEQYRSKQKRPRSRSKSVDRSRSKSKSRGVDGEAERLRRLQQTLDEYSEKARRWLSWVKKETHKRESRQRVSHDLEELRHMITEIERFRSRDLPPKHDEKLTLAELYSQLLSAFGMSNLEIESDLSTTSLDRAWNALLQALELHERELRRQLGELESMDDLTSHLDRGIKVTNGKLDGLGNRIGDARTGIQGLSNKALKDMLDDIVKDLHALEPPIDGYFKDVEKLRAARHGRSDYYHGKVYGLHDRRTGYLGDVENLVKERNEWLLRRQQDAYEETRADIFRHCEQCIEWTEQRMQELREMEFPEDHETLQKLFEKHKQDNQIILDFHKEVDICIARQSEVSAEDAPTYANLLSTLESNYQQLRDLSMGRMLDLDSLTAWVSASQRELDWITDHEEPEVKRDWSDISLLDFGRLQKDFKRLILEINNHETQFNTVHSEGAALLNSGHPAGRVIESYLNRMQTQWDWLLSLTKCFEVHFEDAQKLSRFMVRARECEEWIDQQKLTLESRYGMSNLSLEEGERYLQEIEEIGNSLDQYHDIIMSLLDESSSIPPLWQRGEQIDHLAPATAICEYPDKDIMLQKGDDCLLLDNSELVKWLVQSPDGTQGHVPSINLRIPPPDDRMLGFLQRLRGQYDKVRKLWNDKNRLVRFNMIMNTMRSIRSWDLEKFLSIEPDQREGIMNALNVDTNKLIGEMDPMDPLAIRLKEELDLTNEHFYRLLQLAQKGPDDDLSADFDRKLALILPDLEKAWKQLNEKVQAPIPDTPEKLEKLLLDQKSFEDQLQGLDSEIAAVKEIFHSLKDPSPMQRARMDELLARWEDLWELSRLYVDRLKSLEELFNSLLEVTQIVKAHEQTLETYKNMPADLEAVRAHHSTLLELNMVLKQQQPIIDDMGVNAGHLRQHVARTRYNVADHPDVDDIDEEVQRLVDRWENVGVQVADRLEATEHAIQDLIAYRSTFENELPWLEKVEGLIDTLRSPEAIKPEDYQAQLDMLLVHYNQLAEHTQAFETMNHDGGKFIREAKTYDIKLEQYQEVLAETPPSHYETGILRGQSLGQMDRKLEDLEDLQRKLAKLRVQARSPENQQLARGLHDLRQILATLPHLDTKLEQKLEQLAHLQKVIQELQSNFQLEETNVETRLKNLHKSRQEVIDQAHYERSLKESNQILRELQLSMRKLDELERQRQFEVFETKRRLLLLTHQQGTGKNGRKPGHVHVSEELDDANRRFSQLASIILEKRNEIHTLNQNWKRRLQDEEALRRAREAEAARLMAEVEKSFIPTRVVPIDEELKAMLEAAPNLEDRVKAEANALKAAVERCFLPITGEPIRKFLFPTIEEAPLLNSRIKDEAALLKAQVEKCFVPLKEEPVKRINRVSIDLAPNINDRIKEEALHLKAQVEKAHTPSKLAPLRNFTMAELEPAPNLNDRINEEAKWLKAQVEKCYVPLQEAPAQKLVLTEMLAAPKLDDRIAEEAAFLKSEVEKCLAPIVETPLKKPKVPEVEAAPLLSDRINEEAKWLKAQVEKAYVPLQEAPAQKLVLTEMLEAPKLDDRIAEEAAYLKAKVEKCLAPIVETQLKKPKMPEVEAAPLLSDRINEEASYLKSLVEKCYLPITETPAPKLRIVEVEKAPNLNDRINEEAAYLKAQVERCHVAIVEKPLEMLHMVAVEHAPLLSDRINEEAAYLKAQVEKCYVPIKETAPQKLLLASIDTAPNLNDRINEEAAYLKSIVESCKIPVAVEPLVQQLKPAVEMAPGLVLETADDVGQFNLAAQRADVLKQQIENENGRLREVNDEIRWLTTLEKPKEVPVRHEDVPIPQKPELETAPHRPPPILQSVQQQEAIPLSQAEGFEEPGVLEERAKVAEHEEEVEMFQEETITKTQFYKLEAVKVIETGEILTFVEAVRQGLLDLHSGAGEFYDIVSGSKISLEKAVELGYITQNFNDCLNTHHGIRDPSTGQEVTLLQAIQLGLYDPDSRQLRDPATGEPLALYDSVKMGIITLSIVPSLVKMGVLKLPPMHLKQAIDQRVVNVETGTFTGRYTRESMPLQDALRSGYISLGNEYPPLIAVPLSDCLNFRFINPHSGEFKDKNSDDIFSLKEATEGPNPLVNLNVREVVNTRDATRVTLGQAIAQRIINLRNNTFNDSQLRQPMQLQEAVDKNFLEKPLTLAEADQYNVVDSMGRFVDAGLKRRMTLLEAVAEGLLDPDARHIVDPEERDVISISEALERGILGPDGQIHHIEAETTYTINEAIKQGLLVERAKQTIFDVKAIKDTKTGRNLTFSEAVDEGIIIMASERVADMAAAKTVRIDDALEQNIIDPTLHQILTTDLGLKDNKHLSLFQAVCRGIIEPQKKIFLDQKRNQELSPKDAYDHGLLSLKGAMLLSAIFDVHETLITTSKPTRIGKKRISRPGGLRDDSLDQVKITLADAMRQGIVDARTQRYRQGDEEMSLQEALNQGLINAEREWIVPDKAMAAGPTIEESVTEKTTETNQALAPKVYPDKTLEESVTTVKKVKTTETVAVGGPGGVSAYRAVTGGKGSLEVPVNGFHLYEAERKGLIDLSTGIVSPPDTSRKLNLEEAFELGIINSKQLSISDSKSGRRLSPSEAIAEGLMSSSGHIVDHNTGRSLTLQSAIESGIVIIEAEPPALSNASKKVIQFGAGPTSGPIMSFTPVGDSTFEESETVWTFDTTTGEVLDEYTGNRLPLDDAIRMEKVEIESVRVKDSLTGREMGFDEAKTWGIIDKSRQFYTDKRDGKRYSLQEAATLGHVFVTGDVPENAHDAMQTRMKQQVKKQVTKKQAHIAGPAAFVDYTLQKVLDLGWYNKETGLFTHPDTGKQMTLKESIIKGLFNPYDSFIIDNRSGEKIGLLDAIQMEIVDATTGMIKDSKTGRNLDLMTANEEGLVSSAVVAQSLHSAIQSGQLQPNTGIMKSADGRDTFPLHEAIKRGHIDGMSINILIPGSSKEITFHEGINKGIVNLQNGYIQFNNNSVTFAEALISGALRPAVSKMRNTPIGLSIEPSKSPVSLTSPKSGKLLPSPHETPLARVRHAGRKTPPPVPEMPLEYYRGHESYVSSGPPSSGRNTTSTRTASYGDSSTSRLDEIFGNHSPYASSISPRATEIHQESRSQALVPARNEPIVPVFSGNRREEMVDIGGGKKVNVKVVRGDDGVDRGEYIDPTSGMKFTVQLHGDPFSTQTKTMVKSTSQVQSVELEPHAELVGINKVKDLRNGRIMSLNEAQRLGIAKVDKKGKHMTKMYAIFRSDIGHALNSGVINPSGGDRMSLEDGIRCKLININQMTYANPVTGEILDFTRAANMGLMDVTLSEALPKGVCNPANGERLTIGRAISMGIINADTGKVINPFNKERITWLDIIKPIYKSLTMGGVYDPIKGYPVPLSSALNDGLIDAQSMVYTNPITGESLPLPEAVKKGLMDSNTLEVASVAEIKDWRTGKKMNLFEAIAAGLVDTRNRTVVLSQGLVLPVYKAVQDGKFPSEVGSLLKRAERWTFAEALGQGLIDVASNQFTDPDSGNKMTLEQAFDLGYVDTETVHGEGEETNLTQIVENLDYDDDSGRLRDRKTGLTHTFRQAMDERLIEPDSLIYDTESGNTMTLREAVIYGLIDNNGKYTDSKSGTKVNLKDAVQYGLIALIPSPAKANQAVAEAIKRRDAEGFKFKLEKVDPDREQTPHKSPQIDRAEFASVHVRRGSPPGKFEEREQKSTSIFKKVKGRFSPAKKEHITQQKEQARLIETTPRRPPKERLSVPDEGGEIPLKTSTPMETVTPVIHFEERVERVDVSPPVAPRRRIVEARRGYVASSDPNSLEPSPKLPRGLRIVDVSDIRETSYRSSPRIEELPSDISVKAPSQYEVTFSDTVTFPRGSPRSHSSGGSQKASSRTTTPDLNIRIRTDDTARRMRPLIDDPEALEAYHKDFFQKLEKSGFPLDENLIKNPVSGRMVSTRQAIETGLLDVITGEVAHPMSGRRYSLPKSVRMQMLPTKVAGAVMEILNISRENLSSSGAYDSPGESPVSSRTTKTSRLSPSGETSEVTTREVSWKGRPRDLREQKGDLSGRKS